MGFLNASFIAGAAERASEIMQEERENAQKISEQSMKFWTETGIDKYKERKAKRKTLRTQFNTLTQEGFTPDQIEVIARENKTEAVLGHIDALKRSEIKVKPAEIVSMTGDYKDTGRTTDQILDGFMGKVNKGMSMGDAIADLGGEKTGFLGQDLGKVAQKRADAIAAGFGYDVGTLRALATDDITVEDAMVTGRINLVDPVAAAQARKNISGGDLTSTEERMFRDQALLGLGIEDVFDKGTGTVRTVGGTAADKQAANRIQLESVRHYNKLVAGSEEQPPMSSADARIATLDFVAEQVEQYQSKKAGSKEPGVVGGADLDYSGVSMAELPSRISNSLQGLDLGSSEAQAVINRAQRELEKRYMEQGSSTAKQDAEEAIQQIINSLS